MYKKIKRNILLNPGPATTTDTVKMAQVVPDICPREIEFSNIMNSIRKDLLRVVNANENNYSTVLFGGSGTAIMESIISSVVMEKETLLIIINGAYGERMKKIAQTYNLSFLSLEYIWGTPIDFIEVEKKLQNNDHITHIAMVHHETTTGILNSIEKFSLLGKKFGATLLLDAISSYAGVPIDLTITPIDYLMSTSNKCIQGIAGASFSICNKSKLDQLKDAPYRSLYLNLFEQYIYLEQTGQMRFTPPVQVLYALRQAINEYFEEGELNRYQRYKNNWQMLKKGLEDMGFNLLLNPDDESHILLTVIEPNDPNYNFNKLHDLLFDDGFTIYPGKILNKKTFRLSIMGNLNKEDIENFLNCLKKSKSSLGIQSLGK